MRAGPAAAAAVLTLVLIAAASLSHAQTAGDPVGSGDAEAGDLDFQTQCVMCHAPEGGGVGPSLTGVVGRKAGSAPGFAYSAALKASGVVWTDKTLNAWITDPQAFIPGAAMPFKLDDAKMRADIIAYLGTQK